MSKDHQTPTSTLNLIFKMWIEFTIFATLCFIFFYRWVTKNYDFFEKRNIPCEKPIFLLGNGKDIILRRKSLLEIICEFYNKHDGIVYGVFDNRDPVFLIRDPQLIKQIMIKDFDHFVNHRRFKEEDGENLFNNSLFLMQNEKWRDMRNTLSPAFTGSKMRQMFQLIVQSIDESMKYLQDQMKHIDPEIGLEVDVKDFTTRLTNDIIASTAFGLQLNSFKDRDNEFYAKGKKATKFSGWQQVKMVLMMLMPKLAEWWRISKSRDFSILKLDLFDKEFSDYFMRLVLDAMKYRLENNIHRPDMINLLMEAKGMIPTDTPKTHFREWSDVEVVAQCFVFFFAGFEPSSGLMSFAAHELMEHPEVQEKLYEEIQQVNEDLDENKTVTYEILKKMPYMDMVVSEMLRKWPVSLITDRCCSKDFVYESNGERLEIKKGEFVRIPMCAIQRDPKYYPNPEVIDPERFNEENKSKIDSGTYLPFGLGPRSCIASRFAILEAKAFLYHLIRDYRLEASAKTTKPLVLSKSGFQLIPENGFWLQFKQRK